MTTSRDAFLYRVRQAVQAGNRPGISPTPETRGDTGYQGAGPDPVARFATECAAAGGQAHVVPDREAAVAKVIELLKEKAARKVLVGRGRFVDTLDLNSRLTSVGLEVISVASLTPEKSRGPFFAGDVGISGADYLIAETGSVVMMARPEEPRSLSLLPPVHIVIAERSQLLPDLFDLFDSFPVQSCDGSLVPMLPSCISLITGPSKTGDIELRLVTGVHGPGEIHVVLCAG
jgi:L-lactate utilization protein LutC